LGDAEAGVDPFEGLCGGSDVEEGFEEVQDWRFPDVAAADLEEFLAVNGGEEVVNIAGGDVDKAVLEIGCNVFDGGIGTALGAVGGAAGEESAVNEGVEEGVEGGEDDAVFRGEDGDGAMLAWVIGFGDVDEGGGLREEDLIADDGGEGVDAGGAAAVEFGEWGGELGGVVMIADAAPGLGEEAGV